MIYGGGFGRIILPNRYFNTTSAEHVVIDFCIIEPPRLDPTGRYDDSQISIRGRVVSIYDAGREPDFRNPAQRALMGPKLEGGPIEGEIIE